MARCDEDGVERYIADNPGGLNPFGDKRRKDGEHRQQVGKGGVVARPKLFLRGLYKLRFAANDADGAVDHGDPQHRIDRDRVGVREVNGAKAGGDARGYGYGHNIPQRNLVAGARLRHCAWRLFR